MKSSPRGRVGFVTCRDLTRFFPAAAQPLLTHDDYLAAQALEQQGVHVVPVIWGGHPRQLAELDLDLLVVRSPWDYADSSAQRSAFASWLLDLAAHGLAVENPVPLMLWNLDKHYLGDLQIQGIPIVPTHFLAANEPFIWQEWLERWGEVVVKPCVSAGARDTFRLRSADEALKLLQGDSAQQCPPFEQLRAGRPFMVQPYLASVELAGEWSLIFLNGHYSHAVLKKPKPGHWLVQDELGGSVHSLDAPAKLIEVAEQAFNAIVPAYEGAALGRHSLAHAHPLLYGRVDLLETSLGVLVGELELVEPELFFLSRHGAQWTPYAPALATFSQGVLDRLPARA